MASSPNFPARRRQTSGWVKGSQIRAGARIKTWFMPSGTSALSAEVYQGPLQHLWPEGARIIGFTAKTSSGVIEMTVGNNDLLELA